MGFFYRLVSRMTDSRYIKEINSIIENGALSLPIVLFVFRNIRIEMESEKSTSSYPHLSLYCNFLLHPYLERNLNRIKLLNTMADGFIKYDISPEDMISNMYYMCGLYDLRIELLNFSSKFGINKKVFDSRPHWSLVTQAIVNLVTGVKVIAPDVSDEKKYNEYLREPSQRAFASKSKNLLAIKSFCFTEPRKKNQVCWKIEFFKKQTCIPKSVSMAGNMTLPKSKW